MILSWLLMATTTALAACGSAVRFPPQVLGRAPAKKIHLVVPSPTSTRMSPAIVTAYVDVGREGYDLKELGWTSAGGGEYYATGWPDSGVGPTSVHRLFERFTDRDLVTGYQWTQSAGGTSEYYLEASGGGRPDIMTAAYLRPDSKLKVGGTEVGTEVGRPGGLTAGKMGYGDNDGLGFETIYLRLSDGADPDSKGAGYVTLSSWWLWTAGTVGSLGTREYGLQGGTLYMPLDPSGASQTFRVTYDVSQTGTADNRDWQNCLVEWGISGGTWASTSHRDVTDPRTGSTVDLGALGSQQAWSAAWCVGAGTWTITCRITNADGDVTTLTDTVTVASDTRTQYVVDSGGGGDYTTLSAAIAAHGAANNVRYLVEDGHTETLSSGFTLITGDNQHIKARGTGTMPVFSGSYTGEWVTASAATEGFLLEGVKFTPTALISTNSVVRCSGSFWGVVGCAFAGTWGGNCFSSLIVPGGHEEIDGSHHLSLNNTGGATRNYSFIIGNKDTGVAHLCLHVIGNTFEASSNESIVRFASLTQYGVAAYNDLDFTDDTNPKSCLRLVGMTNAVRHSTALCGFRNKLKNGSDWIGQQQNFMGGSGSISNAFGVDLVRFEGNLCDYSTQGSFTNKHGQTRTVIINNVFLEMGPGLGAPYGPWTEVDVASCCNTVYRKARSSQELHGSLDQPGAGVSVGNLLIVESPGSSTYAYRDLYGNSGFHSDANVVSGIGSKYALWGGREKTLTEWNALSQMGKDRGVPTTLSRQTWVPSPPTAVGTPRGAHRDYYGAVRKPSSWAGAVASPR